MRLTITIELDNDAFEADRVGEIERILTGLCERLPLTGPTYAPLNLSDENGNWVGEARIGETPALEDVPDGISLAEATEYNREDFERDESNTPR